jgi:hypothetical protein
MKRARGGIAARRKSLGSGAGRKSKSDSYSSKDDFGAKAAANRRDGKFSGPIVVTIEQLAQDPRFRDISWRIFTDGVLPPHVQINFLRMMHVFFMEGLGDHVGQFLDENQVSGRRLAKMITTVDESRIWFECSFLWAFLRDCCWAIVCCARRRQQKQQQQEIFRSQSVVEDGDGISFSISYENPLFTASSNNKKVASTVFAKTSAQ